MKKDKFAQHIAAIKRHENHIATMEMLLGALWNPTIQRFVKVTIGKATDSYPWHWDTYYDLNGVETGRPRGHLPSKAPCTSTQAAMAMAARSRGKSRWA